jgi:ankyrin repeat protein
VSRRRLWEIGATTLLLVAVAGIAAGFFAWRERQRRLDRELRQELAAHSDSTDGLDLGAIRRLVRRGASIHVRGEGADFTVLHAAVGGDDFALAEQALRRGSEVNARDAFGYTALIRAAGPGRLRLTQLLLAHGADIHARDAAGRTVLRHARDPQWAQDAHSQRAVVVRLLQQHGARE